MSNIDKTIRIGVDSKDAVSGVSDIRKLVDQANRQDVDSLKEQLRLLRQKAQIEDEISRKRVKSFQSDIQYGQRDLDIWKLEREKEASGLKGKKLIDFNKETREEETARRLDLLRDKSGLSDLRTKSDDERADRKKQIKHLQELIDTTKTESNKTRGVFDGARALVSGNSAGIMRSVAGAGGVLGGAIAIGTAIYMGAKAAESGLEQYSAINNQMKLASLAQSVELGWNSDISKVLGKGGKKFTIEDYVPFLYASGGRVSIDESKKLQAAEQAANIPRSSTERLLNIGRYSNSTVSNTLGNFDEYLKSTNRSITQLPELIQSYLTVANGILNRSGKVDSVGLQNVISSIGKSYGIEGVNVDRFARGFEGMGQFSDNPILLSLQQQTLRELYPNKSQWDKMKIMRNPLQNGKYLEVLVNKLKNFAGGGDQSKFAMLAMLEGKGLTELDIDDIFDKKFNYQDFQGSNGQRFIDRSTKLNTGNADGFFQNLVTTMGLIPSAIVTGLDEWRQEFVKDYKEQREAERQGIKRAVKEGASEALKDSYWGRGWQGQ